MLSFKRFIQILDAFILPLPLKATIGYTPAQESPVPALPCGTARTSDDAAQIPIVEIGREFVTPVGRRRLQVLKLAGQGTRARVFHAIEPDTRQAHALKVIVEPTPVNLASIRMETAKADALMSHGLPCSRIFELGETYVLKEWIDGIVGDDWVRDWLAGSADPADPGFQALIRFYHDSSARGLHVDNLKPANMMLRGGTEWVPIDPGKITADLPPGLVIKHYQQRFVRRWLYVSRLPFRYQLGWAWWRLRSPLRLGQP